MTKATTYIVLTHREERERYLTNSRSGCRI